VTWVRLGGNYLYTPYNFSHFAIYLLKLIKVRANLTQIWQKQKCTVFFWDTVYKCRWRIVCSADARSVGDSQVLVLI